MLSFIIGIICESLIIHYYGPHGGLLFIGFLFLLLVLGFLVFILKKDK